MILDSLTNRDHGYFFGCFRARLSEKLMANIEEKSNIHFYVRMRREIQTGEGVTADDEEILIYINNKFYDWLQNRNLTAYAFELDNMGISLYIPMTEEQELEFCLQWL